MRTLAYNKNLGDVITVSNTCWICQMKRDLKPIILSIIDKNITLYLVKWYWQDDATNLLKDNATDYEVSVFFGIWKTVVSESNMLDAVILGKDNVEIDKNRWKMLR